MCSCVFVLACTTNLVVVVRRVPVALRVSAIRRVILRFGWLRYRHLDDDFGFVLERGSLTQGTNVAGEIATDFRR